MKRLTGIALITVTCGMAQEADRGLDLRMILGATSFASTEFPDKPAAAGLRALIYPTWKINSHWVISGLVQVRSRPYFAEEFSTPGYGLKTDVLQASIGYSQFWSTGSILVRAGELPSAFGSFLLRYSDLDNPVIDAPLAYGYYYRPVTSLGLMGAQIDVTWRRLDARAQLSSSSPANRRNPLASDQYANWTLGAGYTIIQGLRIGVSAFRGPYLSRQSQFFFPGESNPNRLPATAYGADVSWARGHTTVNGEWERVIMTYHAIPTFVEQTGFGEVKQAFHPRWFVAGRAGYLRTSFAQTQAYEGALAFRTGANQLVKLGYQLQRDGLSGKLDHIVGLQYATELRSLVWADR